MIRRIEAGMARLGIDVPSSSEAERKTELALGADDADAVSEGNANGAIIGAAESRIDA